jgi:hypothetical protein
VGRARTGFGAFAYGLAHVFGVPFRAASSFYGARESYYESRLAADEAKQRRLDWKAEKRERLVPSNFEKCVMPSPPPPGAEEPPGGHYAV